ncbi:hypothetical protein Kfla_3219 [Kribbella flavida DSM 17836]|uniref:Uncharacterized protein n=1 Tax=Kribbella flavida (strain DSM 17836 / JCM 10339 / NBRC 14399) TaxID=479435 RepID=D2Q4G7_KRIFD|nr:hypothetical protein [Kribbella flavida]ADB32281.1 hypothetical protein Kfla_3219 [Kribbella flavida DSM 17836]
MNPQLDPPAVPPLTPARRARLRHQVLDQASASDPTGRLARGTGSHPLSGEATSGTPATHGRAGGRRWLAPALAVGAVAAVAAGTVVVSNGRPGTDGAPAAGPSASVSAPATPSQQPTTPRTPTSSATASAPWLAEVDLGPAGAAETAAVAKRCKVPGAKKVEPLWSRKVAVPGIRTPPSGVVVLTKSTPGQPGGTYGQGLFACFPAGMSAAVRDTAWSEQPTRANGVVTLADTGSVGGAGDDKPSFASFQTLFRARPEIARIESRATWRGGHGQWTKGAVAGGFAYTHSTAIIPAGEYDPDTQSNGVQQQIRAFDADGNQVPVRP